jgi:hypothetical protein
VEHPSPVPSSDVSGAGFEQFLPLEAFDNHDFEIRSPRQWQRLIDETADAGLRFSGLPARALDVSDSGTSGVWRECHVLACNEKAETFDVLWSAPPHGGESKDADDGDAPRRAVLPRLHVCFKSEDPTNFARRVAAAYRSVRAAVSIRLCLRLPLHLWRLLTHQSRSRLPPRLVGVRLCDGACVCVPCGVDVDVSLQGSDRGVRAPAVQPLRRLHAHRRRAEAGCGAVQSHHRKRAELQDAAGALSCSVRV